MPYRDVGAASQSMDTRQSKASRKSEGIHNSFPRRRADSFAISCVVVDDETRVTSPRRREGDGGGRSDSFYLLAPDETRPPSGEKTAAAGSGWPISGSLVPMSTRVLGSRSFAWVGLARFLPSFLPFFLLRAALFYSLNYRIDHSRSPRDRPSRSSRESGTADCLTRRPVVRLHMTQPPQSLLRGRFYGSLPLARRENPPPIATTPDSRYQRRSAPL